MDMAAAEGAKERVFSNGGDLQQAVEFAPVGEDFGQRTWTRWLSEPVVVGLLRLSDCCIILASGLLAFVSRFSSAIPSHPESYGLATGALLAINVFWCAGLYGTGRLDDVDTRPSRLMAAWVLVFLILIALAFVTKTADQASRLWVGLWFVYGLIGLLAVRFAFTHLARHWRRTGRFTRNLVVAGAGAQGQRLAEHLRRSADHSVRVIGIFDDDWHRFPHYVGGYPVLGTIDDLLQFARSNQIDQIVVALPSDAEDRLLSWMRRLRDLPVDICLCPSMVDLPFVCHRLMHVGGVPLLNIVEKPLSGWKYLVKAIEDRALAALMLALLAPTMVLIGAIIRLDSPGKVLFRQKRYGFNNEIIEVLKFRTMYADAAQLGEGEIRQASRCDPRVTQVGRFLRRTSLDELPQLLNVLGGTMSLVGPRPHAVAHNEQYAQAIDEYLARHRVKPGITGWAQVNGLRGETVTLDQMKLRVQYDLYYIENWSLLFDLRIIIRTLLFGFTGPNAY